MRGRDQNYGLRFTGYINVPTDGTYTFYTTSDDGTKLMIGNTTVVSNDGVHGDQEQSGSIGLKAGKHAFTIVYFQGVGGQSLSASYSGPNLGKQAIPASAFYRVPTTTTTPTTPTTPAPTGSGVYLSDLTWSSAVNGYGPAEKDKSNGEANGGDGRTITLNGQTYAKGLGVHASSTISYNLGGQYTQFITDMGIDDEIASASCGTVEFQVFLDGNKVYSSGTMNAATATKSVTLDVSGKQTLTLVMTDAGDGAACDHGDWAGARLMPKSTTTTPTTPTTSSLYLSDLTWSSAVNGYGPVEKDKSNGEANAGDGRTITLNGQTYAKGLGVHASSTISYNLGGQYTQFITDMGIDDEITSAGCGTVEFQVFLDGNKVYSSGTMNAATATKSVVLDVSGKQTLTLVMTDAGDGAACDHGDWAGARLTKTGSSRIAATVQPEAGTFTAELYPNPAHETLHLRYWAETPGDLSLQLLSESGRAVRQQVQAVTTGENLISLPVQDLSRGFYVLSLIQGQQRVTRKVILSE
nr:NPCBM/NEW2 domain-containing protein [Spirosoma rhododendri]